MIFGGTKNALLSKNAVVDTHTNTTKSNAILQEETTIGAFLLLFSTIGEVNMYTFGAEKEQRSMDRPAIANPKNSMRAHQILVQKRVEITVANYVIFSHPRLSFAVSN